MYVCRFHATVKYDTNEHGDVLAHFTPCFVNFPRRIEGGGDIVQKALRGTAQPQKRESECGLVQLIRRNCNNYWQFILLPDRSAAQCYSGTRRCDSRLFLPQI